MIKILILQYKCTLFNLRSSKLILLVKLKNEISQYFSQNACIKDLVGLRLVNSEKIIYLIFFIYLFFIKSFSYFKLEL